MSERPGWTRSLPFGLFIGMMVLEPGLLHLLPPGFDARGLYAIRTGLALISLVLLWHHYSEVREKPRVSPGDWAMAVGVGAAVFFLWVNLDFQPLAFRANEGYDPRTGGSLDSLLLAVRWGGATLVVPVMEELFWRSFIMRWLQRSAFLSLPPSRVGYRALFISSVLFAAEHRLWFAGLLAGLLFGWLYRRTDNLWVPILAHAVTNGLLGGYVIITGSWSFW